MDLPVHVAAGALAGNVILYAESRFSKVNRDHAYLTKLGIACFLWGIITHLFLDALPYYDWLFHVPIFKPLPQYWIYPQILTTLPVIAATFHLTRDRWFIAGLAMFGGMFPDIEKLAYFDFNLPETFVLFRYHSCRLSSSVWEDEHKILLSFAEVALFAMMMALLYRVADRRNPHRPDWREALRIKHVRSVIS